MFPKYLYIYMGRYAHMRINASNIVAALGGTGPASTSHLNCDGVPAILGASGFLFNATYFRPAVGADTAPTNSKYDTIATGVMLTPSYRHAQRECLHHVLEMLP